MIHFNENLRNWLLGKSEIDYGCSAVPPLEETPEKLLDQYSKTVDRSEMDKINKKLSKMGYEIKVVHLLKPKKKS